MDEILETRINIKLFWRSKLGLEIKRNAQWIKIKYEIYMFCIASYRHDINLLFI